MAAKLKNLVQAIETDEEWESWMEQSSSLLLVIDVYKEWCGPCVVMRPTFERLFLEHDNAENRIKFFTACANKLKALEEYAEDPSCKPLFVACRNKAVVAKVSGANAPELVAVVNENIPALAEDE